MIKKIRLLEKFLVIPICLGIKRLIKESKVMGITSLFVRLAENLSEEMILLYVVVIEFTIRVVLRLILIVLFVKIF